MTRMTVASLLASVDVLLPDNVTAQISPADVRSSIVDTIDSVATVFARNSGSNSPGISVPLTTTPSKLPVSIYTSNLSGNLALLEARLSTFGDLLVKTAIGRLSVTFALTAIAPSGTDIVITIAQNGVVSSFRPVFTGRGSGNPVSTEFSWIFPSVAVNDKFDVWAAGLTASPTITLQALNLQGLPLPQYT